MQTARCGVAFGLLSAAVLATPATALAVPVFSLQSESISVATEVEMGIFNGQVVIDQFAAGFVEITTENPGGMYKKALTTDLGPFQTNLTLDQLFESTSTSFTGFASFAVVTSNLNQEVDSGYRVNQDLSFTFDLSEAATVGLTTFIENNGLLLNPEIRLLDSNGNILVEGVSDGELNLAAGEYTLVALLSGRDKFNVEVNQSASFGYSLIIIPSPGSVGLLGVAGLVLVSRRRR